MPNLVITVEDVDDDDFEWLRNKCVPAVEEAVSTAAEEGRLDGDYGDYTEPQVSWEES